MIRIASGLIFSLLFLSGCAELSTPSAQTIKVIAQLNGQEVTGATCDMKNNNGQWSVKTPGQLSILGAFDNLVVTCKKEGMSEGSAQVESRYKGNVYRDVLGGRGVVAFLDHSSGAAYDYPSEIAITMGNTSQRIAAPATPTAVPATTAGSVVTPSVSAPLAPVPTAVPTPSNASLPAPQIAPAMSLEQAVKKCAELGFITGTEAAGMCALKLSK